MDASRIRALLRRSRIWVPALVLLVLPSTLAAEPSRQPDISVSADRVFAFASAVELSDGLGATAEVHQYVGRSPMTLLAGMSYGRMSLEPITAIHVVSALIGAGVRAPLVRNDRYLIMAGGGLTAGPYVGALGRTLIQPNGDPYENQVGVGAIVRAGAQLAVHFGPRFSVDIGGDYAWYAGLTHTARLRVGASLAIDELGVPVELVADEVEELYPSLANRYGTQAPIEVELFNRSRFPVTDLQIRAAAEGLIDGAALAAHLDRIEPDDTARTQLRFPVNESGAFNESERSVQLNLEAGGLFGGRASPSGPIGSVETTLFGRNAMTWTDDRKAASFVTPTSDAAIRLAREVSSVTRGLDSSIDPMLQFAMVATEAISVLGIEYSIDPNLPTFVNAQANTQIVDYLQYPEDTLRYASGDCDDLSILFASMLEAAGVRAGFITVPGHLFSAVQLSMTPEQAAETFPERQDYIVRDGRVWIPVETTITDQGFVSAWKTGARQWNDANETGSAELIPIGEAWDVYPPAFPQAAEETRPLNRPVLREQMDRELLRFIQSEFAPAIERLEGQIADGRNTVRSLTNLGVLYARAGATERAEQYFREALDIERHPNLLMNLGNISRIQGELTDALAFYQEAEVLRPSRTSLWLSIALTLRELDRLEESEQYYERYAERRPAAAAAYAHLGSPDNGVRASLAATEASVVLWEPISGAGE